MNNPFVGSVNGAIGSDAALPARSDHVWKCIVSVGPMLIRIRSTSTLARPLRQRGIQAVAALFDGRHMERRRRNDRLQMRVGRQVVVGSRNRRELSVVQA